MKRSVCIIMMAVFIAVACCLSIILFTDSVDVQAQKPEQKVQVKTEAMACAEDDEFVFTVEPVKVVAQATVSQVKAPAQSANEAFSSATASSQAEPEATAVTVYRPTVEEVTEKFEAYMAFAKEWIYNRRLYGDGNADYAADGKIYVEVGTPEVPDVKTLKAKYAQFFAQDESEYDFFNEFKDENGKLYHVFCGSGYNPEQNLYFSGVKELADGSFEVKYIISYEGYAGIDFSEKTVYYRENKSGEWLFHNGEIKKADVDFRFAFKDYVNRYAGSGKKFATVNINGDKTADIIVSDIESNYKEIIIFENGSLESFGICADELYFVEGENILVGTSVENDEKIADFYCVQDGGIPVYDSRIVLESGCAIESEKLTAADISHVLNEENADKYIW